MFGTLYFFGCCALLIAGYAVYGAFVERVFGADASRKTPVMTKRDGVDFEPMPLWKLYMSQMINIAGLGPVIGTILGALYGPVALLWVVFGSIFAGAVHDYIAGMISIREDGISYPEIIGRNLGSGVRIFMESFTVIFMVMVGATFVLAPAALLANLFPNFLTNLFPSAPTLAWSVLIFAYYFVATIIPFDRIVSRFYPIVGVMLIFMALGLIVALFVKGYTILPNTDFFTNVHPAHTPVWPILFITIACGAISGFHATQSPLRARCMTNEKQGRRVFYGAMITEGLLGLIWATLALSFYPDAASLSAAMGPKGAPTVVVQQIAITLLGPVGGLLAILGVVLLPISTGDTAFRAARGMLADRFHIDQKSVSKRILTAVPLFCGGGPDGFRAWVQRQVDSLMGPGALTEPRKLILRFVVGKDGRVTPAPKPKYRDEDALEQTVRQAIAAAPAWTPATIDGERVRFGVSMPVAFSPGAAGAEYSDKDAYRVVEVMPKFFGGGLDKFRSWVMAEVRYPSDMLKRGVQGRVVAAFVVDKEGRITMVEILESPHPQFSEAVARVLGRAPRWTPGRQDGALVRVEYTLPVDFKIRSEQRFPTGAAGRNRGSSRSY